MQHDLIALTYNPSESWLCTFSSALTYDELAIALRAGHYHA